MTAIEHSGRAVPVVVNGDRTGVHRDAPRVPDGPALTFVADGDPIQQGSKRIGRNRRTWKPILIDDNDVDLAVWRENVAWCVTAAMRGRSALTGALKVAAVFTVARPKSAPKSRIWPSVKPDLDKYVRALFDAIKTGGGYTDDALVVEVNAVKSYPGVHPLALPTPGVHVRVWRMTDLSEVAG